VAVPVPEAGIPRQVVEAARAAIKNNRKHSSAGRRFWELSGGIIRCGVCGNGVQTRHYLAKGKYQYGYYRCRRYQQHGDAGCDHRKSHRADKIEAAVW
jgi:site-specific DNA recombinase